MEALEKRKAGDYLFSQQYFVSLDTTAMVRARNL